LYISFRRYKTIWGNSGKCRSKLFVLTSHTRNIELKKVGEVGEVVIS
jgi:hypothetical protein